MFKKNLVYYDGYMDLTQKKCVACEGDVKPLTPGETAAFMTHLKTAWDVAADNKKISREFIFKSFKEALFFINRVGQIAEQEGHHPDIHNFYNRVILELSTHSIGGLSENDFIMAAKIEALPPVSGKITIDDFKKVELRVGKILTAEAVPDSDKLVKLSVDIGKEKRQIVAGIRKAYPPEVLVGKEIVIIANLEPRQLLGLESQGMLLAAEGEVPVILIPEKDVPPGAGIR